MVDLHMHSTCSDGSMSAEELLRLAEENGVDMISITDHDSVDAYFQFDRDNVEDIYSGRVVPGIELTTTYNGEVIEVLGYNVDAVVMRECLDLIKIPSSEFKKKLYDTMLGKYRGIGVVLDDEALSQFDMTKDIRKQFMQEMSKHEENDKFYFDLDSKTTYSSFLRKEMYNSSSELFIDFSPLKPSLDVVLEMIHVSGGLAFLAHTFVYSENFIKNLDKVLDKYGFDGIECYYSSFTRKQTDYLLDVCKRRGLLVSGGSDYHGGQRPNVNLGKATEGGPITNPLCLAWGIKND